MEKEYKINGMSCGHCVMSVEKELNKLDIKKHRVKIGSAKVKFDPEKISEDDIISAIKEAGYIVIN